MLILKKNMFKDGNGEIDQSEMEEVFSKLCRIVNCEQQEVKIHLFAFDILFFFFLFFIDLLLISGGGCESRRLEQQVQSADTISLFFYTSDLTDRDKFYTSDLTERDKFYTSDLTDRDKSQ